jgi:hypothetical protein
MLLVQAYHTVRVGGFSGVVRSRASVRGDDFLVLADIPKDVTGYLFDEVSIGDVGRQKGDVAGQLAANRFKAFEFKIEQGRTVDDAAAGFEAVAAIERMIGEIGR